MLVREVMKKQVITIDPDVSIQEAARLMQDNSIGSLLVSRHERIIGILTDRDIVRAVAQSEDTKLGGLTVGELMTDYLIVIQPDAKIEKAVTLMLENKIKRLPVMEDGRLLGILTATDVVVAAPRLIEALGRDLLERLLEKPKRN